MDLMEDDVMAVHQGLQEEDNVTVYEELLEDAHGIFPSVED